MVFKFLLLCALVPFSFSFAEFVFSALLWITRSRKPKEKSLAEMFEDGDLKTDLSFPQQYILLAAVDEDGQEVEIEGLEDDFDKVDIERYKRKLEANKGRGDVIILEI